MATVTTRGADEAAPDGARVDAAPDAGSGPGPDDVDPADRPARELLDKRAWWTAVLLLHACLAVAVAVYLVRDPGGEDPTAQESRRGDTAASATADPVAPDRVDPGPPTGDAEPSDPPRPPRVRDILRADFTEGDPWPVSAGARDTSAVSWPMGVVDRLFVHGPADGPGAVSWLERWLRTDVRAIGARVRFASERSGAVALTAWRSSVLDETGTTLPRTGMRLVATPGSWRLVAIDGRGTETLAAGSYRVAGRSASFGLVRRGPDVWVTDPAGVVTHVSDPRVATLAGPWASWELRDRPGSRPAALQAIWAG